MRAEVPARCAANSHSPTCARPPQCAGQRWARLPSGCPHDCLRTEVPGWIATPFWGRGNPENRSQASQFRDRSALLTSAWPLASLALALLWGSRLGPQSRIRAVSEDQRGLWVTAQGVHSSAPIPPPGVTFIPPSERKRARCRRHTGSATELRAPQKGAEPLWGSDFSSVKWTRNILQGEATIPDTVPGRQHRVGSRDSTPFPTLKRSWG